MNAELHASHFVWNTGKLVLSVFLFLLVCCCRLEEEKGSGEQPQAALGVSLTPARIRDIRGVFVFGGRSHEGEIVDDCFFYNAASRKWSKVKCQGEKPPKRCFHAAAFSAKTQSLYVFGGQGEDGKALAGTWKLAGGSEA